MKKTILLIFEIIAILLGIFGIIKLVPKIDIAVGAITLTFGVLAIIWTIMAILSLSKNSAIRSVLHLFLISLILILCFAVLNNIEEIFGIRLIFYKYFIISITFILFAITSYKILNFGKEFGFKDKAKEIQKILKNKK